MWHFLFLVCCVQFFFWSHLLAFLSHVFVFATVYIIASPISFYYAVSIDFSSTISRSGLFPRYSSHVNTHSMTQFHDRLLTKSDYTSYCCVRNNFWHYEPYMTLLQMMHYNQCSFDIIISVRLKLGQIIWCTNDQSSLTIEHMPVIIWVSFRCRNAESKTTEGHDGKIYKVFYLAFTHSCYQKHLTFFRWCIIFGYSQCWRVIIIEFILIVFVFRHILVQDLVSATSWFKI